MEQPTNVDTRPIPQSWRSASKHHGRRKINTAAFQAQAIMSSQSLRAPSDVVIQVRTINSCLTVSISASPRATEDDSPYVAGQVHEG
jgi:hypothetical protein